MTYIDFMRRKFRNLKYFIVMFFALSLLFAFVVLYFMIYSKSDSQSNANDSHKEKSTKEIIKPEVSNLDIQSALMPDELYFLRSK